MNNMRKKIATLIKNENFVVKGLFLTAIILSLVLVSPQVAYSLKNSGYGYGYSANTYGYGYQYSDALPSAPGGFSCSATSTSSITCTWSAVTTTTVSTSLDNFSAYYVYYSTTSPASNSNTLVASVSTQSSGLTATQSSLSENTIYYFAAYTADANSNDSAAATASATTQSGGGGGGGSSGGSIHTGETGVAGEAAEAVVGKEVTAPTLGPAVAAVIPLSTLTDASAYVKSIGKQRDLATERTFDAAIIKKVQGAGMTISNQMRGAFVTFLAYASTLGSGEGAALVGDIKEVTEKKEFTEKILNCAQAMGGQVSSLEEAVKVIQGNCRNLQRERVLVPKVLGLFKQIYKKAPDFKTADNIAWNMMLYRIRPAQRNLTQEGAGLALFTTFIEKAPRSGDALGWAAVKAITYSKAPITQAPKATKCFGKLNCEGQPLSGGNVTKETCKAMGGVSWGYKTPWGGVGYCENIGEEED